MDDKKTIKGLEPWSNLNGKVVLITGASSGLDWDLSINLAKAGCKVIATARIVDRLKSLCHLISHQGIPSSTAPRAVALDLDIPVEPSAVEAAIQKAWSVFGRINVLINNAGIRGHMHSNLSVYF